jgi:hypothetical protein
MTALGGSEFGLCSMRLATSPISSRITKIPGGPIDAYLNMDLLIFYSQEVLVDKSRNSFFVATISTNKSVFSEISESRPDVQKKKSLQYVLNTTLSIQIVC